MPLARSATRRVSSAGRSLHRAPTKAAAALPTSLKLPAALKKSINALALKRGQTAHAFMVQTLAEAAERARLREEFVAEAQEALRDMVENGREYELDAVREYFSKRAAWRDGNGPKPRLPAQARSR